MPQVLRTKGMEKTLTTLSLYLRVAAIRNQIRELSQQEQIEVLRVTLMEVSNPRHLSVKEKNDEFLAHLKEKEHATRLSHPDC